MIYFDNAYKWLYKCSFPDGVFPISYSINLLLSHLNTYPLAMASLIDTFVPSNVYNSLPLISQVAEAPEDHASDLRELRDLLSRHNVPKGVSVRLIHKHFDTTEGEVMVVDKTPVPGHGIVQIMKPVVPLENNQLRGIHYFVNSDASFQAYEYGNYKIPDITAFESFLAEFCTVATMRGLQHKFGLKLQSEDNMAQTGWTEFELRTKRGTIMFPDGMPMPDGDSDYSVTTEWRAILNELPKRCKHYTTCSHGATKCAHCKHCNAHQSAYDSEPGFCLGGQKIMPGTSVYNIVDQIISAF
ncbi:hypothetical protein OCU04_000344 [Sclerotinia nivalis]|uniref:Uncharacterized protein n=1 Tax=Sclerotinia nivalis TaxID=352851 RepID=A0A9X0AVX2_9HELO|nr:hypothetical protein OCU04_000344 [Sclerotinia nivalis]